MRWEKSRIQLVTDRVWAQSQEGPGWQHQGQQGPQPHTLFVGGLPAGSHSPRLPVSTTSPSLPPLPSQMLSIFLAPQGPDPSSLSVPTGGHQQPWVQGLCEEAEAGWAAPGVPHADGGGHTLLLRAPGEGPVLHRQRGSRHSRSVPDWCPLSPLGVARGQNSDTRKGGAWDRSSPPHGPSLQTPWGPHCPTWPWSWRYGPRQPPA